MHAVNGYREGLRIDLDHRRIVVQNHVCFADGTAVLHSNRLLGQTQTLIDVAVQSSLGNEVRASCADCTTHRTVHTTIHQRLASWQRSVGVTHYAVADHAALDNHLGFGAEHFRSPQHQVSHFAHFDRTDYMADTVSDSGVDGHFGNIAQNAEVVVVFRIFRQLATSLFHGVSSLDGTLPVFTDTTHGLGVGREHGDSAQIVQHVFRSDGFRTNAAFSEGSVGRNSWVQVVAHADHVEQLSLCVHAEWQAGVGRRRQHVHEAGCTDDVRSVTATATFRVECVDCTTFESGNGVFHIAGFVQRVGVDGNLHIVFVGYAQAGTNRVGSCTPVFVDLECANAGFDLLNQSGFASALTSSSLTFTHQAHVQRHGFLAAQHLLNVPHTGSYGSSVGTVSRTKTTSHQSGTATSQSGVVDLRADGVNVGIDTTGSYDGRTAVDGVGSWAASHARSNALHGVGVTGFTDTGDFAVFDTDVGLDHALDRVNDGGVGQNQVQAASTAGSRVVEAHAVTQCFTTTEHGLVTIAGAQVFFNFNKQVGVAQANFVAYCGAVQTYILFTRNLSHFMLSSQISGMFHWKHTKHCARLTSC